MNQHFSEFALKLFLSHQQQKLLFSFLFLLLIMNFALFLLELYLLQMEKKVLLVFSLIIIITNICKLQKEKAQNIPSANFK